MSPTATLTGEARAIYETSSQGERPRAWTISVPIIPLLNHPQLAKLIEQLGYYYKYESAFMNRHCRATFINLLF